jgi:hypothetical protein
MRVLRRLGLILLAMSITLVAITAAVSLYFRIEQYWLRLRAEGLLQDMRGLELGKSSADDAKKVVARWGFARSSSPDQPCTADDCDYFFELTTPPHHFVDILSAGREEKVARRLMPLGRRPATVRAWIGVRQQTVRAKLFSVWISVEGKDALEILQGEAGTRWRGPDISDYASPGENLEGFLVHPGYLVGAHVGMSNLDFGTKTPVPMVWAEFLPGADPKDVSRLMRFHLGCLTEWRSCKQSDLMPAAWEQHIEDARFVTPNCTQEISRRAARLADVIAVVRLTSANLEPPSHEGGPPELRGAQLVSLIQGPKQFSGGGLARGVEVESAGAAEKTDTGSPMRPGQQYIFLLENHNYGGVDASALYPCGVLTLNNANLGIVREAAKQDEEQ